MSGWKELHKMLSLFFLAVAPSRLETSQALDDFRGNRKRRHYRRGPFNERNFDFVKDFPRFGRKNLG